MAFEVKSHTPFGGKPSLLRFWLALVVYGMAAGACSPGEHQAGPQVRDSSGVTIVENESPAWTEGEEWHVGQEPILNLGVLDGDTVYQFFQVAGALQMPDGRLAVGNGGTGEIRFYDSEGAFLGATQGKGSGPGEFEDIFFLEKTRGDSLLAYDWRNRRLSVMDPHGKFAGHSNSPSSPLPAGSPS